MVGSVLAVNEESVYFQNFITEIDTGKCERKESLVSDLFYSSLMSFLLIIPVTYFQ